MTWEAITALGTVFTGVVVLVTALVGIGQLRQFRGQRRDAAAVELVKALQDDSFLRAYRLVFSLPTHLSGTDLADFGSEFEDAILLLGFRFETLGVLVYRETIPFDIAEDLVGGLVIGSWLRSERSVIERRAALDWPQYLEWFQWLAEQFEGRDRRTKTPAHILRKSWRPRSATLQSRSRSTPIRPWHRPFRKGRSRS